MKHTGRTVQKDCVGCGKSFLSRIISKRDGWTKFCSKSCAKGTEARRVFVKTCKECGVTFEGKRGSLYCCGQCGERYRRRGSEPYSVKCANLDCDNEFMVVGKSTRRYCSKECKKIAQRSPKTNWMRSWDIEDLEKALTSGTRAVLPSGYILVRVRPAMHIYEHRLVMEQKVGRALRSDERVHHINGDRSDNRVENLELWSSSHPAGQRVIDKVAWAQEILQRYKEFLS